MVEIHDLKKQSHKKDFMLNVEIPNWPLSSLENFNLKKFFSNWFFSFFKSERQSIYTLIAKETLYLEF